MTYKMSRHALLVENEVESIAEEIMAYLHDRPMASDSLDGIVHWWLLRQAITKNMYLVEQALEQLTKEGKILKKTNANREAVYSLNTADSRKSE